MPDPTPPGPAQPVSEPPRRHRGPGPEDRFATQLLKLAKTLGWQWVHFRPARTKAGWKTPVSGPLGAGWPDYLLVRRDRLVIAELKSDVGKLSAEQAAVLDVLRGLVVAGDPRIEVYVWRPRDLRGHVADVLR